MTRIKTCKEEHCSRVAKTRGWCQAHYERWKNGLDLKTPIRSWKKRYGCKHVTNGVKCPETHYCKGYCHIHYVRSVKGHDMDKPLPGNRTKTCSIDGCHNDFYSRGKCHYHYYQSKRKARQKNNIEQKQVVNEPDLIDIRKFSLQIAQQQYLKDLKREKRINAKKKTLDDLILTGLEENSYYEGYRG